jgi:hypothetical protein
MHVESTGPLPERIAGIHRPLLPQHKATTIRTFQFLTQIVYQNHKSWYFETLN